MPGSGWTYGADLATMRALVEYWAEEYDWRRHESELNDVPQLMATLDGQRIHVLHARSKEPGALPLVITHGWPGSIAEFRHMIGPLVDPVDDYMAGGSGYVAIQSTRPQTLAYSLADSPVGLLAWIGDKFWAWTDHDGDFLTAVSRDDLLTNVSIYWFTGTGGSSARMYYESMRSGSVMAPAFRDVPLGIAVFPKEILYARRRWLAADYDIARWTELDRGGHFAALEEPDLLVQDVRAFFRPLR